MIRACPSWPGSCIVLHHVQPTQAQRLPPAQRDKPFEALRRSDVGSDPSPRVPQRRTERPYRPGQTVAPPCLDQFRGRSDGRSVRALLEEWLWPRIRRAPLLPCRRPRRSLRVASARIWLKLTFDEPGRTGRTARAAAAGPNGMCFGGGRLASCDGTHPPSRRSRKKACTTSRHGASSTPPTTANR